MKNLLKFIGIGLVLVMAVYSQGVAQDAPVEAAVAAIANNDIEFLENDSNNEGQVVKHYPATSAGGTNAQTHDVRFYINDSDLNKVQDGLTTIRGNNGNANVNTIQKESTIELDADDKGTIDASDAESDDDPLGAMTDTDGYDSAGTPKTALVANTLAVKLGTAVKTFQIDAQDDVNGTFSLSADAVISDTVFLTATYKFNSVQEYSAVPTGTTGAGVDINTRRVKVTSTSDSGGEWVAIGERVDQSRTHDNINEAASKAIDSSIFAGTVKIGSDASYAASGDSTIWVQDGDTLTVTYYAAGTDSDGSGAVDADEIGSVIATTTATIDDSAPSIGNVSPADGTLTKDTSPDLSFTITDTGAGFGSSVTTFGSYVAVYINGCIVTDAELGVSSFAKDAITVTYTAPVGEKYSDTAGIGATKEAGTIDCTDLSSGDAASEAEDRTSGGYEINTTANNADSTLKRTIDGNPFPISIVATDAAGNSKTLGARTGGGSTDLDVYIDSAAPAASSVTGAKAWSSADKKDVDDNSSIKVVFDESIDIDSVTASDFSISGTGVTSSEIVSITSGGGTSAAPAAAGTAVYLDLAADLGPNAKPKVKLVSTITDLAGNELKPTSSQMTNNGGITLGTAADGVKPTLSGMTIGDNLLDSKETTKISLTSNENLTKTNETLANGCTCGSVTGGIDNDADLDAGGAGGDTSKLSVTLSTPTTGSANIKETAAPFSDPTGTPSAGIYGIVMVGKDAGGNKGIGGIVKVTDEDISKYFTVAGKIGTTEADAAWNNNGEELTFKAAKGPLADHDGDGELSDSIIGMSVGGTAKLSTELDDMHVEHIDLGEAESITLKLDSAANFGAIAVGSTVKISYYYVADDNIVEVDKDAPTATFSPADGSSTTDTTPSISVTWDDDEYGWDSFTTVTLTKAEMKDPDGVTTDISAQMTSTDNKAFYFKPTEALALGEYKMTFKAKDATDNESSDKSFKFTVKARSKTSITMSPGWNLISLPGEPADNAINTVITNSQITTVLTYDPSTPGGWLTAVRDGDSLVGTLETIDASHAYWVLTNNSDAIKVDIPGYTGGVAAVPPAIDIVVGWNLIPAVSLSGATSWDIDLYLAGLTWVKAKSWNAATEAWIELDSITDNGGASMTSGKGYWLYATKAGTLVP